MSAQKIGYGLTYLWAVILVLVCRSNVKRQSSTGFKGLKAEVTFQLQSLNMCGFNVIFQICANFRDLATFNALVHRGSRFVCGLRKKGLNHLVNG